MDLALFVPPPDKTGALSVDAEDVISTHAFDEPLDRY
jgi:hypothetical protein